MINEMAKHVADWLTVEGRDSDIIISSRIRLARNLQKYSFVEKTTEAQQIEIMNKVLESVQCVAGFEKNTFFDMALLNSLDKQFLLERRLISSDFIDQKNQRGFVIRITK